MIEQHGGTGVGLPAVITSKLSKLIYLCPTLGDNTTAQKYNGINVFKTLEAVQAVYNDGDCIVITENYTLSGSFIGIPTGKYFLYPNVTFTCPDNIAVFGDESAVVEIYGGKIVGNELRLNNGGSFKFKGESLTVATSFILENSNADLDIVVDLLVVGSSGNEFGIIDLYSPSTNNTCRINAKKTLFGVSIAIELAKGDISFGQLIMLGGVFDEYIAIVTIHALADNDNDEELQHSLLYHDTTSMMVIHKLETNLYARVGFVNIHIDTNEIDNSFGLRFGVCQTNSGGLLEFVNCTISNISSSDADDDIQIEAFNSYFGGHDYFFSPYRIINIASANLLAPTSGGSGSELITFTPTLNFTIPFKMVHTQTALITLALGTGMVDMVSGLIIVTGDNVHNCTFPNGWVNINEGVFDKNAKNWIWVEYHSEDDTVFYSIQTTEVVTLLPVLSSISISSEGLIVVDTYNKTLDTNALLPSIWTLPSGYFFTTIVISEHTITKTLNKPVVLGQTFTQSLTNTAANKIQDLLGNLAASYTSSSVDNNSTQTVLLFDDFNGSNTTDINGRSVVLGGGVWSKVGANTAGIVSNALKITSGSDALYEYFGTFNDFDITITLKSTTGDIGDMRIFFGLQEMTGYNNRITVLLGNFICFETVIGSSSMLFTGSGMSQDGDIVRINKKGTSVKLYRNGVLVTTLTAASAHADSTRIALELNVTTSSIDEIFIVSQPL